MITYIAAMLLAAAGASEDQETHYAHVDVVHEVVAKLAFDPARFFPDEPRGSDLARISYTGDDYSWPVYSMTIRNDCGQGQSKDCASHFRARMVRAPAKSPDDRPRHAGSALVARVATNKTEAPAEIATLLDSEGLQWLEANVTTCPGGKDMLAQAANMTWVAKQTVNPEPSEWFDMVLHADKVKVEFPAYLRSATYYGYIAKDTPAEWATKMAAVLEPCWKPASADARPWKTLD